MNELLKIVLTAWLVILFLRINYTSKSDATLAGITTLMLVYGVWQ